MKIKCLSNILQVTEYHKITSTFEGHTNDEFIVYAISFIDGLVYYYICSENDQIMCVPCPMFEVIDQRLPKSWIFNDKTSTWSFPEWAHHSNFYNDLLNGNSETVKIFKNYKKLIDNEIN
jgi:hypothetical protein